MTGIKSTERTIEIPIEEYKRLISIDAVTYAAIEYASRNGRDMIGVLRIIGASIDFAHVVADKLDEEERQRLNKVKESD